MSSLFILFIVIIVCLTLMEIISRVCVCFEKLATYKVTEAMLDRMLDGHTSPEDTKKVTDMLKDLK